MFSTHILSFQHGHSGELVNQFWLGAMKALRKQLRTSVAGRESDRSSAEQSSI